ncbi:DNA alkylation repair protein [Nitrincola tapanii]|uniref:DNA alkylation repair protein n=1 Tax=Nitrincola tapanii TaxID=1708751 RepID=A0A5A9VZU2_9GAMM|nr:DNA alkylation repair protein [Nitrincola tapanii]KAA0873764.1 DNA alkylation repair protein [Nitrincola tapanii]
MAQPALKDWFNPERFLALGQQLQQVSPRFQLESFLHLAQRDLDSLSLLQRMRQMAQALHQALPVDYLEQLEILEAWAPQIDQAFVGLCISEFVALYGQADQHQEASLQALKSFTRYGSSEFALRPFLQKKPELIQSHLLVWCQDPDAQVRRLCSEATRPRLPWAPHWWAARQNPQLTLPLLRALQVDASLYVRRSVANHLNDLGKDHPNWLVAELKSWPLEQPPTLWICRHALRSLIKAGHQEALACLGVEPDLKLATLEFSLAATQLTLGDSLPLNLTLVSSAEEAQNVVVDYALQYVGAGTQPRRKVFKWKAASLEPGVTYCWMKKQKMVHFSTRKLYPGEHRVDLLINGQVQASEVFWLQFD